MTSIELDHVDARLRAALDRLAVEPTVPTATLAELRVDSLTLLRVVIDVLGPDSDAEIDAAALGGLRTVAELRDWLAGTLGAPAAAVQA